MSKYNFEKIYVELKKQLRENPLIQGGYKDRLLRELEQFESDNLKDQKQKLHGWTDEIKVLQRDEKILQRETKKNSNTIYMLISLRRIASRRNQLKKDELAMRPPPAPNQKTEPNTPTLGGGKRKSRKSRKSKKSHKRKSRKIKKSRKRKSRK